MYSRDLSGAAPLGAADDFLEPDSVEVISPNDLGWVPSVRVGGIRTSLLTKSDLAELMIRDVESCRSGQLAYPRIVTSSNGYVVAKYNLRPDFKRIVDRADIVDADGMPIVFASRLLCKNEIPERVATTDFVLTAAEAAVAHGTRFYFLGGKPGVAEEAASNLRALFPALQIVGIRNGYFSADEVDAICKDIREAGTDVLWVGMGSPRQEEFAVANMRKLSGVAWVRTCGGLFDHYVSTARRAPLWMQRWGLEWVHRARLEPFRLGLRYLWTNPVALFFLLTKTHD